MGTLAVIILVLFAAIVVQSANIQFFRAPALDASPNNPRNNASNAKYARGDIYAANGQVLAVSVKESSSLYPYRRIYPLGSLTSGVVGFSSPFYGEWALENEYNSYLEAHTQPPQSFAQLLAPTTASDSVTLTLYPQLQRIARNAMNDPHTGKPIDAAAVVLNPKTGAVLGMYSNPNYNPLPLTSPTSAVATAAWKLYLKPDSNGFEPLGLVATQQTFPPGSTFKVITTAAAVVGKPADMTKVFPVGSYTTLPDSTSKLYNSGGGACGGTVAEMLPPSCDPGFALLGLDLGPQLVYNAATSFGFDQVPPLDLPTTAGGAVASYFPPEKSFSNNLAALMISSIGQENVRASALQDALVAAAIGNDGVEMTPHLMSYITGPDGKTVLKYKDSIWKTPLSPTQAAQIVPLMRGVVTDTFGTAYGVQFLPQDEVAAKTGTAQTGNIKKNTDDWLIAFAPASNPTVAVAVVVPYQPTANFGATVAGPIVKCLIEGALAIQNGKPPTGTSTTCAH
ncbi:MAG TPA: penicillin-binding transpeptidase domain-containing protein [Acidimicrobiales bacterium]